MRTMLYKNLTFLTYFSLRAPIFSDIVITILISVPDQVCPQPSECKKYNGMCSETCSGDKRELKDLCKTDDENPSCKCCAPKCSQDTACTLWAGTCVDGIDQCPTEYGTHVITERCKGYNCFCFKQGKLMQHSLSLSLTEMHSIPYQTTDFEK